MDTGGGNAGSSDAAKTSPNSTSETSQHSGCGCASGTTITVRVTPTTGGQFDLQVAKTESVENLKKLISKKLKVPKERICLLHRDRQLRDGTLQENQLMDGSRLTLLPSVETGLLAQRPEQSVMQALESLNDSQVNDFLSGKAPLNLTMRLGDHMMLIQLQLSTVTPSSSRRSTNTNSNTSTTNNTNTSTTSTTNTTNCSSSSSLQSHPPNAIPILPATTSIPNSLGTVAGSNNTTFCNTPPSTSPATTTQPSVDSRCSNNSASDSAAQSSSSAMQTCSKANTSLSPISVSAASPSPVASRNSVMSALSGKTTSHSTSTENHHHPHHHQSQQKVSHQNSTTVSTASESSKLSVSSCSTTGFKFSSPASLPARPFTSFYTKSSSSNSDSSEVAQSSSKSESQHTVQHFVQSLKSFENATNKLSVYTGSNATTNTKPPVTQTPPDNTATTASNHVHLASTSTHSCSSTSPVSTSLSSSCKCEPTAAAKPTLDTRALAEASRNLTQTLKQLSSEVLTSRSDPAEDSARARRQGAIIESMHHHGKGVYSGTFSGTLNPALQDRFGRPKRDISTIIHILNDLLCATPQYRRHARQGHTITVEASSGSPAKSSNAGANSSVSADNRTGHNIDFIEESMTLSRENQATRGKMEQLRLIMEERRARRRARREARSAPYTVTQWSAKSESLTTQQNPAGGPGSGAGSLGTHGDEPMDTTGSPTGEQHVCELNPPEPVVA